MKLAGKLLPKEEQFEELNDKGFDYFELKLTTSQLDNKSVEEIAEICRKAPGQVVSVHTPHIGVDTNSTPYYRQTDEIAKKLSATLVFDSNPVGTRYTPDVYPASEALAKTIGYENDPSVSKYYIKNYHLSNGNPLVLDTAHLHMSEETYLPFIEKLLQDYSSDEIPVIHLADGTRQNDGLAYGKGTVEIRKIVNMLDSYNYQGKVVLEVMPSEQPEALRKVNSILEKQ